MQSSYEEDGTDEERYSLWRHRLLPMARIIGLLVATVFIMLAAWLETGTSSDLNSILDKQMNMYIVQLNTHLNLSDNNAAVPDNVAFGLWKHCFNYAGDWRCLDQNLLYNLDADKILFAAFSNSTTKLTDSSLPPTYANVAIALTSCIVVACTFLFSLWANQQITMKFVYISIALNTISFALSTLFFGWTFHNYSTQVSRACRDMGSENCQGFSIGLEIIFMIVAMSCTTISMIVWTCVPAYDIKRRKRQHERNAESNETVHMTRDRRKRDNSTTYESNTNGVTHEAIYESDYNGEWLEDKSGTRQFPDNESIHTAATDEPLFKKGTRYNKISESRMNRPHPPVIDTQLSPKSAKKFQQDHERKASPAYEMDQLRQNHCRYSELRASFQPIINRTGLNPPPVAQVKQNNIRMSMTHDDDSILAPPELPFARERKRLSHGSGHTFGQVLDSAGETSPGSDRADSPFSYEYDSSAQSTPRYGSPRHRRDSAGSYGFGRSQSIVPGDDRTFSLTPQAQTPVSGYHPLSRKTITDDRINAYLEGQ
ncbi:hypothetical protein INT43_003600 [Umbelopsis isabellina]|uniref:Uncharacterized protein n=1 Tax=Mortierella isabellina TaxID=91625 RepID=A0A8H7PT34_MORIS|nr:hypothetical protein INT43_003600 [Umbelopsis isabellina]